MQNQNNKAAGGYVAPPPSEVVIRTMDSDIKAMALSGGGFVQGQKIYVKSPSQEATPLIREEGKPGGHGPKIFLIILVALVFVGAAGWFVYPILFKDQNNGVVTPPVVVDNSTTTPTLPVTPSSLAVPRFNHVSYLKINSAKTVTIPVDFTPTKMTDFGVVKSKIQDAANQNKSADFLEINLEKIPGQTLAISEFFYLTNSKIFSEDFLATNFEPDFTLFAYQNKSGVWLGIIAKLATDKNWMYLKSEIAKLEKSPNLNYLFMNDPGSPSGNFGDVLESGQPTRILRFQKQSSSLTYGWFNIKYFIISTSEEGLKAALLKL